ncbi:AAA family ATPase [Micromonospora sp. CPCC 205371]|nr:AAA family ATPase [Micromonospora sp. CPCC 205371]
MSDNLIVIAGGPGAGKTTLIEALGAAGYATAPEAGRAIIQDQVAIDGPALPWKDPALFAELMLTWDLRSYRWAVRRDEPVFFDHALAGMPGYYRLIGQPVPAHVTAAVAAFRYRTRVFVAPPWPEIYRNDTERRQSWAEAVRTYEVVAQAYIEAGYELVDLPRASVSKRLEFVLRKAGVCRVGENRAQTMRLP